MTNRKMIPWAKPHFWGKEREYVADALESTWISGGAYVDRLESDVAAYCAVSHALAVANGTAALHLAFLALNLKAGDEIIVPGFGYQAAANIALHFGAKPVFAEVDAATWCMDVSSVERLISPLTRFVVPVHTYGNACDMDAILALCRDRNIPVVEDAAESFGTKYKGRQTGTMGDLGTLSFQATKTLTTGEGGMVLTERPEFVESVKLYRSHGMLRTRYWHEVAGLNFRLTNMQAAIGCAQLEQIDKIRAERDRMNRVYRHCLADQPGITLQVFLPDVDALVWAIGVKLDDRDFPQGRDAVMAQLTEEGIESRPGFYSASAMPHLYGKDHEIPVCDALSTHVISLPSFPELRDEEIAQICEALLKLRKNS